MEAIVRGMRVGGGEIGWLEVGVVVVLLLLARAWDSLERVEGGGWEVRLRGGVGDVEVLRGGARGELVLAQEGVEIGPVVCERVVVEADHWDCCCCCCCCYGGCGCGAGI